MTRGLEYKYIEGYSCYQLHKPALELVKEPRAYHENTPLHNAAYGGHSDIVKYFMDSYEVEDKEPLDAEKFTPLHYAASAGKLIFSFHRILFYIYYTYIYFDFMEFLLNRTCGCCENFDGV